VCAVGALPRVSPQPLSVANRSLQAFGGVSLSQPLGYRSFVGGKVVQNGGEECGNRAFHELSAAQTRMRGGGEGKEIFLFEPNSSGPPMHLGLDCFWRVRANRASTPAAAVAHINNGVWQSNPPTLINRHFTWLAVSDKVCQRPQSESALFKQAYPGMCWNDASMKGWHDHCAAQLRCKKKRQPPCARCSSAATRTLACLCASRRQGEPSG
jgi:hypothetical protein